MTQVVQFSAVIVCKYKYLYSSIKHEKIISTARTDPNARDGWEQIRRSRQSLDSDFWDREPRYIDHMRQWFSRDYKYSTTVSYVGADADSLEIEAIQ